ncbi:metal-dependent hydrolase, partial [Pseudomonas sp. JV551A1]|uniref:metal-dependent hydrolase n=1 Tax=Pseudomonas sp. JV551A1 TaxID=2078787 RepID=UPI002115A5F5
MDSITQAVLGAALQGTVLGRIQGRRSLLYGAALGTLPDLDVIIRYADPVSQMTYHRGFSHSLFVLSGLALGWQGGRWAFDLGTTQGYTIDNWLGGATFNGDLGQVGWSLTASRRPMSNSLLSFAGARDPWTGVRWGGV